MMELVSYVILIIGALALGYAILDIITSVDKETDRVINE